MKRILITFLMLLCWNVQSFSQNGSVLPEQAVIVQVQGNNVQLNEIALNKALERRAELNLCNEKLLYMNSEKYKDSLVIVQQQKTIEDQKSHIKTFESFVAQSKDVQEKSDSLIAYLKSEVKKINRKVGIMGGSLLAILAGFLILK